MKPITAIDAGEALRAFLLRARLKNDGAKATQILVHDAVAWRDVMGTTSLPHEIAGVPVRAHYRIPLGEIWVYYKTNGYSNVEIFHPNMMVEP